MYPIVTLLEPSWCSGKLWSGGNRGTGLYNTLSLGLLVGF